MITDRPPDRNKARLLPLADSLDELAKHIDGAFVLVVKVNGGRYRRRCFMTAASAERAARNALDAGHDATVFLAQLKPLWRLNAATLDLFAEAPDRSWPT
jgi:hypothetical protein